LCIIKVDEDLLGDGLDAIVHYVAIVVVVSVVVLDVVGREMILTLVCLLPIIAEAILCVIEAVELLVLWEGASGVEVELVREHVH